MKKFILILILLTLSGCWNYKELNDYSIITGIAIDKYETDEYKVSVLISNSQKSSSDSSSSQTNTVVYSGTGKSIVEALKDIGIISPKQLYFGSFSILVISDEIAYDGLKEPIDFFLRYSCARKNFNIIIAKDCEAKDTLKIITPISSFPSQNISDNINSTAKLQGIITKMDFNKLLSIMLDDGIEHVINSITIVGSVKDGETSKNIEKSEPDTYVKLGNLGIFRDNKLIKWADEDESIGINLINNDIEEMDIRIDYDDKYVISDTTNSKTKVKISLKNNKPIVNIDVSGEMKIIENTTDLDFENIEDIEKLKNKINNKIEKYIKKAMILATENNTDIFGFGLMFYKNYPDYFNKIKDEWNYKLGDIKLKINSNLTLKNKVSAKNSLEEIDNEE